MVHTDASEAGVGAFLAQRSRESSSDSDLDIIAYYTHRFSKSQRHYSATMKECCAVVLACLLYTSPSPRDATLSRMPSSA